MIHIQLLLIVFLTGFVSLFARAQSLEPDLQSVRQQIIEKYHDISALSLEEKLDEVDDITQISVARNWACARQLFNLEILKNNPIMDEADAIEDWREVPFNFTFYDGANTTIGSTCLNRYIERAVDGVPHPWGANPVHSCIWPTLADLATQGDLASIAEGGWSLIIPDRGLTIVFDEQLRVQMIEHKYDMTKPGSITWNYSGYDEEGKDSRLPTRLTQDFVYYGDDGSLLLDYHRNASLVFDLDPARANALISFRRPDGSVNLVSPNAAMARRIARETGKSFDEVVNASSCGPLELGVERYDPETGNVYKEDGTFYFNAKALEAQDLSELEAQS